jgi:hypothetical protein
LLRNRKIDWLCVDLPTSLLQTRDRSAVLPDRSHLSACLLNADGSLLQAELLWHGFLELLQEGV